MNVKAMIKCVLAWGWPVPGILRPVIHAMYRVGVVVAEICRVSWKWLVVEPVFRSVATVGSRLRIERIPYMRGKGRIVVGSNACISGKINIRFANRKDGEKLPELVVGDNVFIGNNCAFIITERISIGSNCLIGMDTRMQDSDGHILDPVRRHAGEKCNGRETICPVIIEDDVWIAPRSTILKGVRIGRNAVVGVGSVVTKDVPLGTLVAGNPARVIKTVSQEDGDRS